MPGVAATVALPAGLWRWLISWMEPRAQAENHIKAWKRHLAANRTSCMKADANQFRLMLHTGV